MEGNGRTPESKKVSETRNRELYSIHLSIQKKLIGLSHKNQPNWVESIEETNQAEKNKLGIEHEKLNMTNHDTQPHGSIWKQG